LYSFKALSDLLYKEGFRTGRGVKEGLKVGSSKIHVIINDPFYYGMMSYHGKFYSGKHTPIITQTLFEKCQEVRKGNIRPKNKKHFFMLRGLCSCALCGCSITAEKQRGHSYYHCTNGKGICDQKKYFVRGHKLENQISELAFVNGYLNDKLIDIMYKASLNRVSSFVNIQKDKENDIERDILKLETKKDRLTDMLLEGRISEEKFDDKNLELHNQIQDLKLSLETLQKKDNPIETIEQTKKAFKAFVDNRKMYFDMPDEGKKEILFNLLSNITIKERKVVSLQWKTPFDIIAKPPQKGDFVNLLS